MGLLISALNNSEALSRPCCCWLFLLLSSPNTALLLVVVLLLLLSLERTSQQCSEESEESGSQGWRQPRKSSPFLGSPLSLHCSDAHLA